MVKTVEAIYDGKVFQPAEPVELEPNTRVRIIFETLQAEGEEVTSFLRTACALNLEGPPDWSVNLDDYLYGEKDLDGE
jgi:predicted DNA-binding antitoxin AbrB/MazE fold protein